jgi:hypothetical protein
MIQASDMRFAWVMFYKRDLVGQVIPPTAPQLRPAPYAQVIFVATQERVKPAYDPVADTAAVPGSPALQIQLIAGVQISAQSPTGTSIIKFPGATAATNVAEGAFVIVSTDGVAAPASGLYNGRIYRMGTAVPTTNNQFYLAPGEGPGPADPPLAGASVFVVGRAVDPASTAYSGLSQDVSVYTTYVQTP